MYVNVSWVLDPSTTPPRGPSASVNLGALRVSFWDTKKRLLYYNIVSLRVNFPIVHNTPMV